MPYTYEKDKNGRWRARGGAAGSVPVAGGSGFGPAKPTAKRKELKDKPWWWHITPEGLSNDLKYEARRAQAFNRPRPTDRRPVVPIMQFLPPAARQVVAGATVRASADAGLAAVNYGQRVWGNFNRIKNPALKAAVGAGGVVTMPLLGLFGPSRDPESTPAGKAIIAASRAGTKALGGRLPEEMSPSDRDVYEWIPAGLAANIALAPVEALQIGRAVTGTGALAKVARWGLNTAANEVAANLITDNTMGGPSSLLRVVGVPVPNALSADPTRDDRISAGLREIPASMVFAGALGGAAALFMRAPHVARALRDNRLKQDLERARQKTVANGLQEADPATGEHTFTPAATTPPPPPPKPAGSVLEQDAAVLGITPEELAARRGVPYSPAGQPAPAAAPAEPRQIPSIEGGDFTAFGKASPDGRLPQADPALDPWKDDPAYQDWLRQNSSTAIVPVKPGEAAPTAALPRQPLPPRDDLRGEGLADPWGMGPDPNSPVQQALGGKAPVAAPEPAAPKAPAAAADDAEPVYDPELPEIDHVALALERLDPAVVEQIAQTPGPVLPRIEEALANRQPVAPRPELTVTDVVAPTEKLAENQFLTRRDEWANLRDDELLGVFHPEVNPGLFAEAHARTGRSFDELTREDALETLSALADGGATVMPDRLKAGSELARTRDLVADPNRFQYKLNTDRRGVQKGNSLEGLDRWNTSMENTLLVWEDPADGKTYVVNGHNRLAKALELGIPTLPVKRLLASTPEQARALGAMDNIASGGGTPWDAAKFFRDAGILNIDQAGKAGLPLNSGHAEKGLQLAALPDNIFQAGLTGDFPEARALALGASGLSPEKMQSVWSVFQADKFYRGEDNFQALIDLARGTPTTAADSGGRLKQGELPGLESAAQQDLTKTKVKLANKVKENLAADKRALKGASRNADTLETKGNSQIDAQTAMQAGLDAEQLGRIFNAVWWASDNEISALLNAGAEEIAAGAKVDAVARRIQGELAQAAESVMAPPKPPEPAPAPVAPEPPMPKTAQDHEANLLLVLNQAAAQGEVRPSATPIPVPPAPPEIDVAKAARGIDAQDVMGGDSQLKFAQQQRQQALDAGDAKAVEAWDKEIRKVNQGRLAAAQSAQDASQTGLFGVTEYDNSMPLFDQSKLDAEEARLAAEYKERDTALQQETARAQREAMGYHDMTFEQKKAEAGIAEGWAPAEPPPPTSKAGKDLAKKLVQLEELLTNARDVRLPAAVNRRDMLAAKGLPTGQAEDLVEQLQRQIPNLEKQLRELRAKYGIEAPEPAAPPARAIEIPAAADKKLSKSNVEGVAQTLMKWANAGLPENKWPVKSLDQARALVQAKNRHLWSENIPGIDLDKANNDLVMGKSTPAVQDVSNAYRQFYGVKAESAAQPKSSVVRASQEGDMFTLEADKPRTKAEQQKIQRFLEDVITKVAGDDVVVRYKEKYEMVPVGREWGGKPGEYAQRLGFYLPSDEFLSDIIQVNGIGHGDLLELTETAYHEAFHRIQFVALGENEAKAMDTRWARFKVAIGSGHILSDELIAYGESQPSAFQRYAAARRAGQDPVANLLRSLQEVSGAADSPAWKAFYKMASGFDRIFDFAEKVYNLFAGNGFLSTRSIFEKAYKGDLVNTYDYSAAPLDKKTGWFGRTWDYQEVPPEEGFNSLAAVLRQVDGGKLKGVSKRALDAAEKGEPELALREATDYAQRRLAEIDNKIEDIKQRAIKEGC